MDNYDKELGVTIKKLRQSLDWTQRELAERMGVSVQAVSQWETGKNLPSTTKIGILLNILRDRNLPIIDTPAFNRIREFEKFLLKEESVERVFAPVISASELSNLPASAIADRIAEGKYRYIEPHDSAYGLTGLAIAVDDERMHPIMPVNKTVVVVSAITSISAGVLFFGYSTDVNKYVFGISSIAGYNDKGHPIVFSVPTNNTFPKLLIDFQQFTTYQVTEYRVYVRGIQPLAPDQHPNRPVGL